MQKCFDLKNRCSSGALSCQTQNEYIFAKSTWSMLARTFWLFLIWCRLITHRYWWLFTSKSTVIENSTGELHCLSVFWKGSAAMDHPFHRRFCVSRSAGQAGRWRRAEKWEECSVNEDYWSTCDSLNSSGFVLLHPENHKVTLSLHHTPHCDTV